MKRPRLFFRFPWRVDEARPTPEVPDELSNVFEDNGLSGMSASQRATSRLTPTTAEVSAGSRLVMGWHDLRATVRFLVRRPMFTGGVVLILALAIGSSTAVFAVTYSVVLKHLPFPTLARLVELRTRSGTSAVVESREFARPVLDDIVGSAQSFDRVGEYVPVGATMTGWGDAEPLTGLAVSPDLFLCYGVPALWGRSIDATDVEGGSPVMVLSYALWQRVFYGRPWTSLDATTISLAVQPLGQFAPVSPKGIPYRIVGIMPPRNSFPVQADFFIRLGRNDGRVYMGEPRAFASTGAVALLRPGATLTTSNADLAAISTVLAREHPATDKDRVIVAVPLRSAASQTYRTGLFLLLAAVHCVLVVALVSVSSLFIVRSRRRRVEFAIRQSLGATRGALLRQAVAETGLMALVGGACGVLVAVLAVRLLVQLGPGSLKYLETVEINWTVLAYAGAVSVVTAVTVGYASALRIASGSVSSTLTAQPGRLALLTGAKPITIRGAVVACQVAFTIPLLVALLLLARSLANLAGVDPGYDGSHLITLTTKLSSGTCGTVKSCQVAINDLLERFRALPGVSAAAMTATRPLSVVFRVPVTIDGPARLTTNDSLMTTFQTVTPDYFRVMGLPFRSGRGFADADAKGASPVAIVNRAFVLKALGEPVVGRRISLAAAGVTGSIEVVGEIDDAREVSLDREPAPAIYIPLAQARGILRTVFVLRTTGAPQTLTASLRREMARFDPAAPILELRTFGDIRSDEFADPLFQTTILGWFGAVATVLAILGSYCVASQEVSDRSREMAIRLALGGQPNALVRLVLRDGVGAVVAGVLLGSVAAILASRWLEHLVFQVSPYDPLTLGAVVCVVAGMAMLAHYVPARRAAFSDPLKVLRCE